MFSASMTDAGTTSLQNSVSEEIEITSISKADLCGKEQGK